MRPEIRKYLYEHKSYQEVLSRALQKWNRVVSELECGHYPASFHDTCSLCVYETDLRHELPTMLPDGDCYCVLGRQTSRFSRGCHYYYQMCDQYRAKREWDKALIWARKLRDLLGRYYDQAWEARKPVCFRSYGSDADCWECDYAEDCRWLTTTSERR